MKIAVTGANGYLGQGIVKRLLDEGNEVIAADFSMECVDDRAMKFEGDILREDNPFDVLDRPDIVLHLAWRDGFVHSSSSHIDDLPLHYGFIKKILGSGLNKIAVMGSMHEVGFFEGSINEDTPCKPQSMYGTGKNALRNIVELLAKEYGATMYWLRGFYIVGNSEYGCSVFSKITASVQKGQTHFPFTMGLNQFDFIDYDEFCKQVSAAISQDEVTGIINICSGRPEKLADRVERFIKENGYNIELDYGAFPDRPYDSKAIWGDSTKIETIMGIIKRNEV